MNAKSSKLNGLPPSVTMFVLRHFHSVEQLEIFLLLAKNPRKEFLAEDISKILRTSQGSAERRLLDLEQVELVLRREESQQFYYRIHAKEATMRSLDELTRFYQSHSIKIIELIYSRPGAAIRSFANAFRFLDDDE